MSNKVTKINKARELYKKNYTMERSELIELFTKELEASENSARTYINKCASELNASLNLPPVKKRTIDRSSLKKERVREIFSRNPNLTRSEMIHLIHSEMGITLDSASTHCSLIAKEFVNSNHKAVSRK